MRRCAHSCLNERAGVGRRGSAAWGWGGVTRVAEATGLCRATMQAGMAEWQGKQPAAPQERCCGLGAASWGGTEAS